MNRLAELLSGEKGKRIILLFLAVGALLMLLPSGRQEQSGTEETEEARLETVLSQMEGVGTVVVLLSENGAVIVCQGAEDAAVRLQIAQAIRCYTGIGADRVEIFQMGQ